MCQRVQPLRHQPPHWVLSSVFALSGFTRTAGSQFLICHVDKLASTVLHTFMYDLVLASLSSLLIVFEHMIKHLTFPNSFCSRGNYEPMAYAPILALSSTKHFIHTTTRLVLIGIHQVVVGYSTRSYCTRQSQS